MRTIDRASEQELQRFLAAYPLIESVDLLLPDLNGVLRGTRARREEMTGLLTRGASMAASTHLLDTRGVLLEGVGTGDRDGDPDQLCYPVPGSFAPVPWAASPRGQCIVQMYGRDGRAFHADPRHLLRSVVQLFEPLGLRPVVAVELEFYLLADTTASRPHPWLAPVAGTGLRAQHGQLHSLEILEPLEDFMNALHAACALQGIPAGTTMSEAGPGQFEINLHHVADAALACDHAVLLRRLVRAVALRHGMAATFMAKPFAEHDGSGLHVHVSLQDTAGRNVFAGNPPVGDEEAFAEALRHAAGGLLATMPEALAIWAPNANSYRRLRPGHFAPTTRTWGSNHRAAAVRVPLADDANVRLEHRAAGADANPYLVVAAILAGVHHGITQRMEPPRMIREAQDFIGDGTHAPCWEEALAAFDRSEWLRAYFGEAFCATFSQARRTEAEAYRAEVPELDYRWYLGSF